jgi:hypothetical protein
LPHNPILEPKRGSVGHVGAARMFEFHAVLGVTPNKKGIFSARGNSLPLFTHLLDAGREGSSDYEFSFGAVDYLPLRTKAYPAQIV